MGWGLWDWVRNIGGKPEDEADLREEFGGEDPGEAEERYLADSAYGAGLAAGDAADVAAADLDEFKAPRDPAP